MPSKSKVLPPIVPVSGRALWQALGFANERAFQRARHANQLDLPLYPVPGKARGVYARSDDLARYLARPTQAPPTRSSDS
jgi:hypothetical protein